MSSASSGSRSGAKMEEHRENIQKQGAQIAKDAKQIGNEAAQAARDQVEHLSNVAGEYMERGREEALQMAESLEEQIREQPLRSVLVAAGVGFLFGILWLRR